MEDKDVIPANSIPLFLPPKVHRYAQIHQRIHLNKVISSALKRLCLNKQKRVYLDFLCIEAEGSKGFSKKISNVFYTAYILADMNFLWKGRWSTDASGSTDDTGREEIRLWSLKKVHKNDVCAP